METESDASTRLSDDSRLLVDVIGGYIDRTLLQERVAEQDALQHAHLVSGASKSGVSVQLTAPAVSSYSQHRMYSVVRVRCCVHIRGVRLGSERYTSDTRIHLSIVHMVAFTSWYRVIKLFVSISVLAHPLTVSRKPGSNH
jgi:hypothetical protein